MSARDDILQVLTNVRGPRTAREISWHVPHVTEYEVISQLEEMRMDGYVVCDFTPNGARTYALVPEARLLVRDEGALPGPAMACALLVGLTVLAVLAVVVGFYAAALLSSGVKAALWL